MAAIALSELIDDWLIEKQTLGTGLSVNSEAAYRRDLALIARRIHQAPDSMPTADVLGGLTHDDVTATALRGAFADLARSGAAVSSRTRAIGVWKSFTGWLVDQGHLPGDPMAGIGRPRKPEALPVAFTDDQLRALLATVSSPDPDARHPWPLRDRALLIALSGTGVRASELCGMDVGDLVRGDDPSIRVHGKGGRTRVVPLSPAVATAVEDYLADRARRLPVAAPRTPEEPFAPQDPLWVGYGGARLTRGALKQYVYRWLLRAGIPRPEGEAVHAFRHTFATGLISRGTDIATVRQLLGHASIASTQIYLRMTGADLAQAVRAAPITGLSVEG